jgi:chromosome partitioning protein
MIVAFASGKGGVGKTTLAINVVIARSMAGKDVLLVDGDTQGSAADFTALRLQILGKDGYTVTRHYGAELRDQVRKMAGKFHDIIIDVGGRDAGGVDTNSLRAALVVANTVVVPVHPRMFDVWATAHMAALVKEARTINEHLRSFAVINCADPVGKDNTEAEQALRDLEALECLPGTIGRRKAFPASAAAGLSVLEQPRPDAKAVDELNALVAAIFGRAN